MSRADPGAAVSNGQRGQERPALRAITFDFWGTLIDATATPARTAERLARIHEAIVGAGHTCTPEELEQAYRRAGQKISEEAKRTLRDVGPPGRWAVLAAEVGVPEGLIPYTTVEPHYEGISLTPMPVTTANVVQAVRAVKDMGYRLGVICNTGMAGGRVLRMVLKHHGLLDLFDATTWSNEFGWSKPHPGIFEHALRELGNIAPTETLHIGDLEELDVEGARRAGLHAALYAPGSKAALATEADFVVQDWRGFPDQIAAFAGRSRAAS
jgi:2-haloacid dehalogenase/putative hydrolase of the HAD superfamily